VSAQRLPDDSDRRVGDPILAEVDRAQLLLHLDALRERLNELLVEVVEAEVNPLQLIVLLQLSEDRAHTVKVFDIVVLEGQLRQLRPILKVFQDLLNHLGVYDLVLHGIRSGSL
jgi:hypothetical protein